MSAETFEFDLVIALRGSCADRRVAKLMQIQPGVYFFQSVSACRYDSRAWPSAVTSARRGERALRMVTNSGPIVGVPRRLR
jgi:hypothetical protein